ncbi:hypothetical protein PVL29_014543 [Vitis rotundifolia]|uniref:Uncharacterized protein n=1 Tax=Vitis rotundifolia TaxID=103349 RepID=A0AA38ZH34_VITRO|nr:hypothetical protein PVL29_014543 [Vitis rotundifolia]
MVRQPWRSLCTPGIHHPLVGMTEEYRMVPARNDDGHLILKLRMRQCNENKIGGTGFSIEGKVNQAETVTDILEVQDQPASSTKKYGPNEKNQLLFPMNPTDIVPLDHVELDFADVFGPLPVQTPSEMNPGDSGDSVSAADTNDLIYGDPVVIYSWSHSLVGPSTCLSQSSTLSKLALHEIEDSEELVECLHEEAVKELQGISSGDDISEKSFDDIDSDSTTVETVGLEDFEVMKLVGPPPASQLEKKFRYN